MSAWDAVSGGRSLGIQISAEEGASGRSDGKKETMIFHEILGFSIG